MGHLEGPPMNRMIELAERVEKASGPDRNLDAMIHHAVKSGIAVGYAADAPNFTASLDAALSLADDPAEAVHEAWARLVVWPKDENYAEWLARFVTAAALRAQSTIGEDR